MAPKKQPWFRFYVEALTDPKLRRLTPAQRWLWVAVMGASRSSPTPGWLLLTEREPMTNADLADLAGMTTDAVVKGIAAIEKLGLIVMDPAVNAYQLPKWADRQYESDNVTKRTQKHRAKANGTTMERSKDVPRNDDGTGMERTRDRDRDRDRTKDPGSLSKLELVTDPVGRERGVVSALWMLAETDLEFGKQSGDGVHKAAETAYLQKCFVARERDCGAELDRLAAEHPTDTPQRLCERLAEEGFLAS